MVLSTSTDKTRTIGSQSYGRGMFWVVPCILVLLLSLTFCQAELLETPTVQWTISLQGATGTLGGRSLQAGNAIVTWRDKLVVTANDASLHILQLGVGDTPPTTIAVVEPAAVGNSVPECRSSGVLVETNSSAGTYLVYNVIDTPVTSVEWDGSQLMGSGETQESSSRLLAVNLEDGSEKWTITLPGRLVGNPVVGSGGKFVYVSHADLDKTGMLSVIEVNDDGSSAEIVASLLGRTNVPMGPPAIRRISEGTTSDDIVVVADEWDEGRTRNGRTYLLSKTSAWEDNHGRGDVSYEFRIISQSSGNYGTVMAPLLFDTSMVLGGSFANLAAWTDSRDLSNVLTGRSENISPRWSIQLATNPRNISLPVLKTPILSPAGDQLYVVGPYRNVYGIALSNGRQQWSLQVESEIIAAPVLTTGPDDENIMYVVDSMDGRVRQIDADGGRELWQFGCPEVGGEANCQDAVEADFSLSGNGNVLYYGDVFGRISALEVARFPTPAPTGVPSVQPSVEPTSRPTVSASPTSASLEPTNDPTISPTTALPTQQPLAIVISDPPTGVETTVSAGTTDNGSSRDVDHSSDLALNAASARNSNSNLFSDNMGVIIGAGVGGLVFVSLLAFCVARHLMASGRRDKKQREAKAAAITKEDLENAVKGDDRDSDGDYRGASSDEGMDDVTVTSGHSEVEIELGEPSMAGVQTPGGKSRRSRKKMIKTPPTATSLESIREVEDEELPTAEKQDLKDKFNFAADEMSMMSETSLPPPPPSEEESAEPSNVGAPVEEEKKDDEAGKHLMVSKSEPPPPPPSLPPGSVKPSTSSRSPHVPVSTVGATLDRTMPSSRVQHVEAPPEVESRSSPPAITMSPSMLSTDSSLYTADDKSRAQVNELSPLSTGVFGDKPDTNEGNIPEDEKKFMMTPSLDLRPGAHYLAKGSRPKFRPSNAQQTPKVKSARTSRTLNGFTGSYLNPEEPTESGDEGIIRSNANRSSESSSKKAPPKFKRRQKQGKQEASSATDFVKDTWDTFLNDLAEAEKHFFSPTHAQKSAVLRYNKDDESTVHGDAPDDESNGAIEVLDDDDTVKM